MRYGRRIYDMDSQLQRIRTWDELASSWSAASGTRHLSDLPHGPEDEGIVVAEVMQSVVDDRKDLFVVNVMNRGGLIGNLPASAAVEVPAVVDGQGIHPLGIPDLPPGLAATLSLHAQVQAMTMQSALTGDRGLLRQVMLTDPLVAATLEPHEAEALHRRTPRGQRPLSAAVRIVDRRCRMTTLVEPPISDDIIVAEPRLRSLMRHLVTTGWLLPSVALLIGLFVIPTFYAIYLGFTNLELLGQYAQNYSFTGTANLQRMFHDPTFWYSVKLTLIFVIGSGIVAQTVLGLGARAARPAGQRRRSLQRGSDRHPGLGPAGNHGRLRLVLLQPGRRHAQPSLRRPQERPAVHRAHARGLHGQRLARHRLLDAAAQCRSAQCSSARSTRPPQLEGAGYWRRLFTVTLPIMRPTLMINLLLITLGTISDFTLIFAMTQGGPGNQTAILPVYMYIEAFQFNQLGYGTAIALTLVLIGAILSDRLHPPAAARTAGRHEMTHQASSLKGG